MRHALCSAERGAETHTKKAEAKCSPRQAPFHPPTNHTHLDNAGVADIASVANAGAILEIRHAVAVAKFANGAVATGRVAENGARRDDALAIVACLQHRVLNSAAELLLVCACSWNRVEREKMS